MAVVSFRAMVKKYKKLMDYFCFVQARYSSKRLRGKVLRKLGKLSLLEILISRLQKIRG